MFRVLLFLVDFIDPAQWFGDPLSVRQRCSALLLIACVVPAVLGLRDLRANGRPDPASSDDPSLFPRVL